MKIKGENCEGCDKEAMCKRMMILNKDHFISTHGVFGDHQNELVEGGYGMAKLSNWKQYYAGYENVVLDKFDEEEKDE